LTISTEAGPGCAARAANNVIEIPASSGVSTGQRWVIHDRSSRTVNAATAKAAYTDLAGTPHSAPLGRLFLREHLRGQVPPDDVHTAELLTTELISNVVVHAHSAIRLGVCWDASNLLVTVEDRDPAGPVERHRHGLDHERENGRGLQIVANLADDFGWSRLPDTAGKVMWFALALRPPLPRQDRATEDPEAGHGPDLPRQ
jgi:anti-sigma regulatory factor (Ser/Thr protein kinase)